jgi:hypothetical protein
MNGGSHEQLAARQTSHIVAGATRAPPRSQRKFSPLADENLVGRHHMTDIEPDVGLVTPTDTTTTATLAELPPIGLARATGRTKSLPPVRLAIAYSLPLGRPVGR